jgi:hypothetical protein
MKIPVVFPGGKTEAHNGLQHLFNFNPPLKYRKSGICRTFSSVGGGWIARFGSSISRAGGFGI